METTQQVLEVSSEGRASLVWVRVAGLRPGTRDQTCDAQHGLVWVRVAGLRPGTRDQTCDAQHGLVCGDYADGNWRATRRDREGAESTGRGSPGGRAVRIG